MPTDPFEYVPSHRLEGRPHVVVDGSPAEGTTLTLTHWPGFPAAAGTEADLSAQMAFRYLRSPLSLHGDATAVTNNHYDQDGLVGVFALVDPEAALAREDLLVDVAAAGDFGRYTIRDAARISMVLFGWGDLRRTPFTLPTLPTDDEDRTARLYQEALPRIPELCDHPDRFRDLWGEEDAALTASEKLLASGRIEIDERPELDLAIVDVPDDVELYGGHRFAHEWVSGLHPMALYNATRGFTLLVRQGRRYELTYRYESWVQYRSRPVRARRDLGVLAAELSDEEPGDATWRYDGSGSLAPNLRLHGADESAIDPDDFLRRLDAFLATAPADWDPFATRD
jgi:hypothetical protein